MNHFMSNLLKITVIIIIIIELQLYLILSENVSLEMVLILSACTTSLASTPPSIFSVIMGKRNPNTCTLIN